MSLEVEVVNGLVENGEAVATGLRLVHFLVVGAGSAFFSAFITYLYEERKYACRRESWIKDIGDALLLTVNSFKRENLMKDSGTKFNEKIKDSIAKKAEAMNVSENVKEVLIEQIDKINTEEVKVGSYKGKKLYLNDITETVDKVRDARNIFNIVRKLFK